MRKNIRGSSALEYACIVAVVAIAAVAMAMFFRGALDAKWRDAADTFGYGRQVER